jgi:allantoicase
MTEERWIAATPNPAVDALAAKHVDLSHPRLGTVVTYATDDFFAPKERLIDPAPPVFVPGKYDDHGKWMDGWESRRKREPGHDWCVIALGAPGRIRAFDIDTSFFTGNFPPEAMVEAWSGVGEPDDGDWTVIVPRMHLAGDDHHVVRIEDERVWSHLRLHIYPDGGIARLRVFGDIHKDWSAHPARTEIDLAAQVNGGLAVAWNDAHYGAPANMLAPGRGANMGDGWETARRRMPGNDWAVIRLGTPGRILKAVVDTCHFKGNYPDHCILRAAMYDGVDAVIGEASEDWPILLPATKLGPDAEHVIEEGLADLGPVSHVRLDIYPDGGISRLRLIGIPDGG